MATQAAIDIPVVHEFPRRLRAMAFCRRIEQAIDAHPMAVVLSIGALGMAAIGIQSAIKLMWFDEFITFYIAKLGSLRAIWGALANGTDPNPPLSHWLAAVSMRVFGVNPQAARLPFMLAGVVTLVALFAFLRRRIPPLYAAAGVFFFMSTAAFDYFFESRSYALTLVFSALSLFFWQKAAEGEHPFLSTFALGFALAAGIASNYFAVLAFFPIAAGELLRNVYNRRLDWRVWIALAISGSTLLLYLPLINSAVARFSPYAWNKVDIDQAFDGYLLMVSYILWLGVALLVARLFAARCVLPPSADRDRSLLGWIWGIGRRTFVFNRDNPEPAGLPWHEAVAVLFLVLYPFLGFGVASLRGGMLAPRFVLPVCLGIAIVAATSAYRVFGKYSFAGLLFLATVAIWFMAREGEVASNYYDERVAFNNVLDLLPKDNNQTLAVSDSLLALPLYYYAPQIAPRVVFPVDFRAIRQYKGEDSPEQNLWAGRNGVFPIPIVPLDDFLDQTSNFLVVATEGNWMLGRLAEDGDNPVELPIFTDSRHIWAFTPLCHGPVWFFREGASENLTASQNEPVFDGSASQ